MDSFPASHTECNAIIEVSTLPMVIFSSNRDHDEIVSRHHVKSGFPAHVGTQSAKWAFVACFHQFAARP